jgi:hypothetical protein
MLESGMVRSCGVVGPAPIRNFNAMRQGPENPVFTRKIVVFVGHGRMPRRILVGFVGKRPLPDVAVYF